MPNLEDGFYSSPRWSWEILDCAMPMTFDTYSNCAHQCVYCFAYFQRAVHPTTSDDYLAHKVKAVDVERVKRMFLDPDRYAGQFAWYIKRRLVLQWGGLSDGFDWYERTFRKSLELLQFFRSIDYPISISTKGTWFLDDLAYQDAFRDAKNVHIKYSIITLDSAAAKKLEAGTPSPEERFRALERFKALGVGGVTLRFRPYILGVSDLCADAMIDRAAAAGVDSVTTEFLCLEKRASGHARDRYRLISELCGFDVFDFYVKNSFSGSGLLRLNYDLKRPHIARLEQKCAGHGLPFFVSDAHHKEASASAGCCGLPATGPLSNYNRGQFAEAILIAKRNGSVRWSDIAPLAEDLKHIPFGAAQGFNQGDTYTRAKNKYNTMYDYMHNMWNAITSWASPARYFGGALVPGGLDEHGDVIYLFNEPFVQRGERVGSAMALRQRLVASADALRADGADAGHVAMPIYVAAADSDRSPLVAWLDASRLTPEAVIGPDADVAALAAAAGHDWYWCLTSVPPAATGQSARAILSATEAATDLDGQASGLAGWGCVLLRATAPEGAAR